ncbi:redoxin domain-containing protein [Sporosarcina sp. FSL K6-1522]|uniref:redoxin domain-containing protein n=1 Tax=Sporosarcina sp. FSL K6-1522 TaxID=2921554 RepID=UPI00315ACFF6
MIRKTVGLSVAAFLIGTMIVLMVKSNSEQKSTDSLPAINSASLVEVPGLGIGDTPPDFELTTTSGEVIKLSDLKGTKVIVNFWTSWCTWCEVEMPFMQKYYKEYKESANVEIIAVNLTAAERKGLKGVQHFIDAYGLTFPIPLDIDGNVEKAYRIMAYPTTYMLGTDGKIGQQIIGPMDEATMKDLVEGLN